MVNINLQIHALPLELIDLAASSAKELNLYSVGMSFFPVFKINNISNKCSQDSYKMLSDVNRICLNLNEPDISAENAHKFMIKNPNSLSITIGEYGKKHLVESIISAKTDDKECLKKWRKIIKMLKTVSHEGAFIINPYNSKKKYSKKHRYTEAAKSLMEKGFQMRAIAGSNLFMFE